MVIKIITVQLVGNMIVFTKFHGSPSNGSFAQNQQIVVQKGKIGGSKVIGISHLRTWMSVLPVVVVAGRPYSPWSFLSFKPDSGWPLLKQNDSPVRSKLLMKMMPW